MPFCEDTPVSLTWSYLPVSVYPYPYLMGKRELFRELRIEHLEERRHRVWLSLSEMVGIPQEKTASPGSVSESQLAGKDPGEKAEGAHTPMSACFS